jgi:hypothetical protein
MRTCGSIGWSVLFACLVAWLIIRARFAESQSSRLGLHSLAFGIAAFIPGILGANLFDSGGQSFFLPAGGIFELLLAVASVSMAIWALRVRRSEQTGSRAIPILGLVFGVANVCCGAGLMAIGSGKLVSAEGTPWIWKSESDGFQVTLPTEHWKLTPNQNVVAYFTCPRPHGMAIIARVWPAATEADFEKSLLIGKKIKTDSPTSGTKELSGINRSGHAYWLSLGIAHKGSEPYIIGVSVTRVRDRAIVMTFEGHLRLSSQMGRTQEAEALQTQAEFFLTSVDVAKSEPR